MNNKVVLYCMVYHDLFEEIQRRRYRLYNTHSAHHLKFLKNAKKNIISSTRVVMSPYKKKFQEAFWPGDASDRKPTRIVKLRVVSFRREMIRRTKYFACLRQTQRQRTRYYKLFPAPAFTYNKWEKMVFCQRSELTADSNRNPAHIDPCYLKLTIPEEDLLSYS